MASSTPTYSSGERRHGPTWGGWEMFLRSQTFLAIEEIERLLPCYSHHFKEWRPCFSRKKVHQLHLHSLLRIPLQRQRSWEESTLCWKAWKNRGDMPEAQASKAALLLDGEEEEGLKWEEEGEGEKRKSWLSLRPVQSRRAAAGSGAETLPGGCCRVPGPPRGSSWHQGTLTITLKWYLAFYLPFATSL